MWNKFTPTSSRPHGYSLTSDLRLLSSPFFFSFPTLLHWSLDSFSHVLLSHFTTPFSHYKIPEVLLVTIYLVH